MSETKEIIGITENRKNGIVIVADVDYFVKNIDYWQEEFFDKKVRAKGIISITKNLALLPPDDNDSGIIKQGIPTTSWEQYHKQNMQYWITIEEIEVVC